MDISPKVLRKETVQTLQKVNQELEKDPTGQQLATATLLSAKAQCLNTLTLLRGQ